MGHPVGDTGHTPTRHTSHVHVTIDTTNLMPKRPCLECGTPTNKTRCPTHQAEWERARNARRPHYRGDWPRIAAEAVAAHRLAFGDWCPGWNTAAHHATDLTADHIDPRSTSAGVRVLCRACNARRGNKPDSI